MPDSRDPKCLRWSWLTPCRTAPRDFLHRWMHTKHFEESFFGPSAIDKSFGLHAVLRELLLAPSLRAIDVDEIRPIPDEIMAAE
jgi:hypothetical protein